jgi:uncharacterized protein
MSERTSHKPGTFSWVELMTTDADGAKRFYGDVFGWEYEDVPVGPDMTYTMCQLRGKNVSALMKQRDDEREQGIPPHWNNYVTVDDLEARTAKAGELGGQVLAEPFDVMSAGRMSVLQDPAGAFFMLWEPGGSIGAELVNEPGCLTWNDLNTTDPEGAEEFYGALFGWRTDKLEVPGIDYRIWWNGDRTNGGMARLGEEMAGIPPHWVPYFASDDLGGTRSKIEAAGGSLMIGPTDVPQGSFIGATDPQGAAFFVFAGEFDE